MIDDPRQASLQLVDLNASIADAAIRFEQSLEQAVMQHSDPVQLKAAVAAAVNDFLKVLYANRDSAAEIVAAADTAGQS